MSVVGIIPSPACAETIMAWTEWLAADGEEVTYLCLNQEHADAVEALIHGRGTSQASTTPSVAVVSPPVTVAAIIRESRRLNCRRLVSCWFELEDSDGQAQDAEELLRTSPCETYVILSGTKRPDQVQKSLVMTTGGAHDLTALRLAARLRPLRDSQVHVGAVEGVSRAYSVRAGKRFLEMLLHDAALDNQQYKTRVVIARDRRRGILRCLDNEDLVIAGWDALADCRVLNESFGDGTVLIVKRLPALSLRALPKWLPRIHPGDHADLLQDLRQGSRWNSDFVSMLTMASAIASLGLLQNSPAVVIGSMLLAPLMTPMIGAGLALAEAAPRMAVQCTKTIGLGLLLTLGVSTFIGLITPSGETLSPEILARCDANILDLLIGVFAAIAATIAMARPNISGAIAGVAIATALVPPVCSIGLSLAAGSFLNAAGATVLFITNMVAIIISSSVTFTLLGVLRDRALPRHRHVASSVRIGFATLLILLAGPLSGRLFEQLNEGRPQSAVYPVTRALSRALLTRVGQDPGVEITFMGKSAVTNAIVIHIACDHDIAPSYGDELRSLVRQVTKDPEIEVLIFAFDGKWFSHDNAPLKNIAAAS